MVSHSNIFPPHFVLCSCFFPVFFNFFFPFKPICCFANISSPNHTHTPTAFRKKISSKNIFSLFFVVVVVVFCRRLCVVISRCFKMSREKKRVKEVKITWKVIILHFSMYESHIFSNSEKKTRLDMIFTANVVCSRIYVWKKTKKGQKFFYLTTKEFRFDTT